MSQKRCEVVGEVGAALGLAAGEGLRLVPGVAEHHDVRHHDREGLAVPDHAGEGDAADVDAVVGALAGDEAQALALAAGAVVGHDHLQRGVDRLGAGVGEEDVVEGVGQQPGHAVGEREGAGWPSWNGAV